LGIFLPMELNEKKSIEDCFGTVLKELRKGKGLSQADLADASGLNHTYISLLERGKRQPTLTTLFSIAKACDISPSEIISMVEFFFFA
jgi:transcriptional regulator with XRE-family HTH domain